MSKATQQSITVHAYVEVTDGRIDTNAPTYALAAVSGEMKSGKLWFALYLQRRYYSEDAGKLVCPKSFGYGGYKSERKKWLGRVRMEDVQWMQRAHAKMGEAMAAKAVAKFIKAATAAKKKLEPKKPAEKKVEEKVTKAAGKAAASAISGALAEAQALKAELDKLTPYQRERFYHFVDNGMTEAKSLIRAAYSAKNAPESSDSRESSDSPFA